MKRLPAVFFVTLFAFWSLPVYARYGPDVRISPTNTIVEGLSFTVSAEDTGENQERVSVVVTSVKSDSFPTNIFASIELRDKDGFLAYIQAAGKIEGNHMTVYAFLDRRALEKCEIMIMDYYVIHGVDPITSKPTGSAIHSGRTYRIRPAEFLKH
jgi:hypothetical protein